MVQDNRIVYMEIFGHQYPMCMTVAAQEEFNAAYGGYGEWAKSLETSDGNALQGTVDLAHIMMEGGRGRICVLAKIAGETPVLPPALSKDDLKELWSLGDLSDVQDKIKDVFRASHRQTVEVEEEATSKNGKATQ